MLRQKEKEGRGIGQIKKGSEKEDAFWQEIIQVGFSFLNFDYRLLLVINFQRFAFLTCPQRDDTAAICPEERDSCTEKTLQLLAPGTDSHQPEKKNEDNEP